MLERIVKIHGGEFTCATCNTPQPAGSVAHTQFHIEVAEQKPAEIHVGFAPNEEVKRVIIVPRMVASNLHFRCQGRHPVITRKECDACNTKVKLATLRRNCFI